VVPSALFLFLRSWARGAASPGPFPFLGHALVLAALLTVGQSSEALGSPPAVGTAFQSVRISGQKLGTQYTSSGASLEYTIAFDPGTGLYHLWTFTGSSGLAKMSQVQHATSTDGISFTPTGFMSYATAPDFAAFGAPPESPIINSLGRRCFPGRGNCSSGRRTLSRATRMEATTTTKAPTTSAPLRVSWPRRTRDP